MRFLAEDFSNEIFEMEKKLSKLKQKQEEAREAEEERKKAEEEERKRKEEEEKKAEESKTVEEEGKEESKVETTSGETEEKKEGDEVKPAKQGVSFNVNHLKIFGVIFVVLLVGFFIFSTSFVPIPADGQETDSQPVASESAEIQLIELTHAECTAKQCISLQSVSEELKGLLAEANAVVSEETVLFDSERGSELIEEYSISKLPSLIVLGETDKVADLQSNWVSFGYGSQEGDGALVLRSQLPVFFDLTEERFVGAVNMVTLTYSDCTQCSAPISKGEFAALGVKIVEEVQADISSETGAALVNNYNITKVPTVILTSELKDYDGYESFLDIASEEEDGSFVFREANPVYYDLAEGSLAGNLFIIYIEDSSCEDCFKSGTLQNFLRNAFGLKTHQEDVIDYTSSAAEPLIEKYSITKIPTAVISGDVEAYYLLRTVWPNWGIVGEDGAYVFTQMQNLGQGSYTDLESGEIVQQ